ncbi:MAG: 4-alpha-glucanotransferase [Gemmataceae bacterium]
MTTTPSASPRARSSGVLLHPTSLAGPHGIGDLGPSAHAWVEALARAGQSWWQVLPLGPPGAGDSPYQCFSAFAGNTALLSPDALYEDGLLPASDLADARLPEGDVDYQAVGRSKARLLARAWESFRAGTAPALSDPFGEFCAAESAWLDDFAVFMAIKDRFPEGAWTEWPPALARREPDALRRARLELADAAGRQRFGQFLFARQWDRLRRRARELGVGLIGDLPIFVSPDSADVWARPELFLLDQERRPRVVAGVPPDYFSATGQRWGNPLYDWEAMRRDGYAWWADRLRSALRQVDLLRIDHFRGFEAYWEVPAESPTAETGRWVKGPGADLFEALRNRLGGLPLIAEDLGVITPEVNALRTGLGLPGMRILQFAFGGAVETRFLPHNYDRNTVVYTGTHDNDTTAGWFAALTDEEEQALRAYVPDAGEGPAWALIRLAWASVADLAITPVQDVLTLGSEARMNTPGVAWGNWRWRLSAEQLRELPAALDRLAALTRTYQRGGLRAHFTPV